MEQDGNETPHGDAEALRQKNSRISDLTAHAVGLSQASSVRR